MWTVVGAVCIFVLSFYGVHPCARTFAFAREKVAVEQGEESPVVVVYFEYSYVRMVDGNLLILAESYSV